MNTMNAMNTMPAMQQPSAPLSYADGPRLLADIGGTNARFTLETGPHTITPVHMYCCADYASLTDVLRQYFADAQVQPADVRHACLAMAYPVVGDEVRMTNRAWTFSIDALRRAFGFDTLFIINDFVALARAVPTLAPAQFAQIGGGQPEPRGAIGLFGPGTGLGVAGLVPHGASWLALASEGGHADFAPQDEREDCVLRYARQLWPHVSFERIASGPGIELIHRALAQRDGVAAGTTTTTATPLRTEDIVRQAQAGEARAVQTIECFCGVLGAFAGNLAVTLSARGGIYLGGGVARHLGALLQRSPFRQRFESKGRLSAYLAAIPTYVITAEHPAFAGVAAMLAEHLASLPRG